MTTNTKAKISRKTKYVSTDGWRGYQEPIDAVCGANDTGTYYDSPCPSNVGDSELAAIKGLLKQAGIPFRSQVTRTSNVFCVHKYLVVPAEDVERGKQIVQDYLDSNSTRLLYVA